LGSIDERCESIGVSESERSELSEVDFEDDE